MPLSQPLTTIQRELREQMADDLAAALLRLKELLPDFSEKQEDVIALLGRLNDSNKKQIRNLISNKEHQREQDRIRSDFYQLVQGLELIDFEEVAAKKPRAGGKSTPKTGSVLYRIPQRMSLQKSSRCVVRVALDEDAIIENITLDEYVQLRSCVEVSNAMEAQLLDPSGQNFFITSPNNTRQLVRDTGYTEWLFYVTPLHEGTHQLVVKVSILENVPDIGLIPREVTLEETVQIVTESTDSAGEPALKPTGISFALQAAGTDAASLRNAIPPAIDADTPAGDRKQSDIPAAIPPAVTKNASQISLLLIAGVAALLAYLNGLLPFQDDWPAPAVNLPHTRGVYVIVHSPSDTAVEAFAVSRKKIALQRLTQGIWGTYISVPNDPAGNFEISYLGNRARQIWYDPLLKDTNDLFVTMPSDTSGCGFYTSVDTVIRPAERWQFIWQRSPLDTVVFKKVHALSNTTFFVPLAGWCEAFNALNHKPGVLMTHGSESPVIPPKPSGSRRQDTPTGPVHFSTTHVRLLFSRPVSLSSIRVNDHAVTRYTDFDFSDDPSRKTGADFFITQSTADGVNDKAKNYRIEVVSADCDCVAKTRAIEPAIRDTIICRLKPPPPSPPKSTVNVSLAISPKWAAHLEDLEITIDGAHFSNNLQMKNGKVNLELKQSEQPRTICLQFLNGVKSGKPFVIGCYNVPVKPNLKLAFQ
ncbi:MAG: hypothetical protein DYG98_09585 [Haliscomenobacteraceae bacterium CHB4]|nr:hypothetical protein [Saprospiraceae bacterium]MCE7923298.1 hypothetical protein [Haliscomenobacteraceae bacterium CHB4]